MEDLLWLSGIYLGCLFVKAAGGFIFFITLLFVFFSLLFCWFVLKWSSEPLASRISLHLGLKKQMSCFPDSPWLIPVMAIISGITGLGLYYFLEFLCESQ